MAGAREISQAEKRRENIRAARAAEDRESGALEARQDLAARRAEQDQRNADAVKAEEASRSTLPLGSQELRKRELELQAEQEKRNEEVKAAAGAPENKMLTPNTETKDATDAAIDLAGENGIDLNTVRGTGAEGRITKSDVQAAIDAQAE